MNRFRTGIISGILGCAVLLLLTAFQPIEEDSIKYHVDQLENIMKSEIEKNRENGRFQLQSLSIDRTHWHYMLDTATGELYRLELSQTPGNSKWVMMAPANFVKSTTKVSTAP